MYEIKDLERMYTKIYLTEKEEIKTTIRLIKRELKIYGSIKSENINDLINILEIVIKRSK